MKRFTVLGFTEAELGFVLAGLFAALVLAAFRAEQKHDIRVQQNTMQLDSLKKALAASRDSLRKLQAKVSTKVPGCWEKGKSREPIGHIRILGRDRYELGGVEVSSSDIFQHFAALIHESEALKCRYALKADPTHGVDGVDQAAAVWRLRMHFDVNDRPR